MKKRTLLTAILSIVMCLSLMAGATFALFTSESKVNIAITSGKVEMTASVVEDSFKTSTVGEVGVVQQGYVGTTTFENGGIVEYDAQENLVKLTNMAPCDMLEFDIDVVNLSTIAVQYRVVYKIDGELKDALEVNANIEETDYNVNQLGATDWVLVAADDTSANINKAEVKDDIKVSIYFKNVGNDYETKSGSISFTVEAIQGNATTTGALPASTEAELLNLLDRGEDINLTDDIEVSGPLNITGDIVINGNGKTIDRKDGFTGTIFNVTAGSTLTLENVVVDGGAKWETIGGGNSGFAARATANPLSIQNMTNNGTKATGALVQLEANATAILGSDVVLENNDGAPAVHPGTRTGGKVYINGATIQYNNGNGAGAIWGGGYIEINEGSKINHNIYKGTYGGSAVRMVSGCTLTMNGGEMNYNYSNYQGGAIFGYGERNKPTYFNFSGGEMAYNETTGAGAIYTGVYTNVTISGTFKLHDNNAGELTGAIRFSDHSSLTMTGGEIYNNIVNGVSSAFYLNNNSASITGGRIDDNFSYSGGLGLTYGESAVINGTIAFSLGTNHNTAYLAKDFGTIKFTVDESKANFALFNFKPASDYEYVAGDEAKLVCLNEGYEMYWNATDNLFRIRAVETND